MMANRRLNRRQTSYVLAGSMGFTIALALAFFMFAMPSDLFESLVSASGLPALVAAAVPPLGQTARMVAAGGAGLFAGLATATLFLLSDRNEDRRREAAKRPVSAGVELGMFTPIPRAAEGVPLPDPVAESLSVRPLPAMDGEPASQAVAANDGPIFVDFGAIRAARTPKEEPLDLGQWQVVEPPEQEAVPVESIIAPEPVVRPAVETAQAAEDESIPALMQRLEAGLDRRAGQGRAPVTPPAIPADGAGLRSTLDQLRKMAVRR